ncbi:methyltransferase domain-containing protein [Algisphaera agarilytica]|uniref:Arsenite methyltransferase n=1 Tax=Algisphaera agarilytica TaxID=1385975 RepID=A0A7X0H8D6_9BACT|nr:methyltransferase domain-containing protein [Algisphaera agarilytica]MBB6431008.1 ubiquinone/menaquinone biosynthesis C-methylase UbiE [Algisphaera agarilytica]
MNKPAADAPARPTSSTGETPRSSDSASGDQPYNVEQEVVTRYAAGAEAVEAALCCPTSYDPKYLKILPQEIIEKDYGCGDPSEYVGEGEVALDLGSGGGKICYILSQKVGAEGKVIGVDMNDTMLALAEKYKDEMAEKIGHANVEFRKGRIQDLGLSWNKAQAYIDAHPITDMAGVASYEAECDRLRKEEPLVESDSVDVIVSNCVLNLVATEQKKQLFNEMYRVLRNGGRCVISDIVCDEDPTQKILDDGDLWSGCISGAFREDLFVKMFADAGFHGIEILKREEEPWQTIDGVEFRSMTIRAYKGKQGPCFERIQAVVYKGPWSQVRDDDGHVFNRGERIAVCDKTFKLLTRGESPYAGHLIPIEPLESIPLEGAEPFNCSRTVKRHPRETKGQDYDATTEASDCCGTDGCC